MRKASGILIAAIGRVVRNDGILFAGHMAFMAMLSFFPFLVFLTALAGFIGEPQSAEAFIERVFDLVPERVGAALHPAVDEVLAARRGGLLTFSLIGTLWIASSGVETLRHVLNRAYGVEEVRPFWRRRIESLFVVMTGGTLTLGLSLSVILGPAIWSLLTVTLILPASAEAVVGTVRDVAATSILFAILTLLHATLPCRRQRLRDVWFGAALTAFLWIALATGFSLYLSNLTDFDVTYGSLGGVILTLVYFHVSAILFIFGAEMNAALAAARTRRSP
jgi:membrane protein